MIEYLFILGRKEFGFYFLVSGKWVSLVEMRGLEEFMVGRWKGDSCERDLVGGFDKGL